MSQGTFVLATMLAEMVSKFLDNFGKPKKKWVWHGKMGENVGKH